MTKQEPGPGVGRAWQLHTQPAQPVMPQRDRTVTSLP